MTLIVLRTLIMEVELKFTYMPPKSSSLYFSLIFPVSLHASLTCSVRSSTLSGTIGRSILSKVSSINKTRSLMGFAVVSDQFCLSIRVMEVALIKSIMNKDRDTKKTSASTAEIIK